MTAKPLIPMAAGSVASAIGVFIGQLPQLDVISHIIANLLSSCVSLGTIAIGVLAFVRWLKSNRH